MPSILNTSLSGMLAFQRALDVTSHNIANANTPGYSRQVANFSARVGSGAGNIYVGAGTQISSIERMYDAMKVDQLRTSTTGYSRLNTLSNLSGRVDVLVADPDTGLNSSLQSYFNSLQDLANDPSSIPTRQALLGEADGVAGRFNALQQNFDQLQAEVNERLTLSVNDINRLATSIAAVNERIAQSNGTGASPNDLLDERDNLLIQLSAQVSVSTNLQDDGTMSVFIGSGQSLVLGGSARQLSVSGSEFDLTRMEVRYQGDSGSSVLDTTATGGNLGGLLDYRSRILDPSRQSLGLTAVAFAESMNEQHNAGMDLRGNLGGDLFSIRPPNVLYSGNNAGNGVVSAGFSDVSQLTGADYVLEFAAGAYTLTRMDTNTSISLSGAGTSADPFVGDGLSFEVSGSPSDGDRVMIRSTSDAAGSLQNIVTDPQALALAAPTRSSASLANSGTAIISPSTTFDASDPDFLSSSVITFTGPNSYSINGAGSFAYIDGSPIQINGSQVTISGSPAAGDEFTVTGNFGATGDNSNGLNLAAVQSAAVLDGDSRSIQENYGQLVARIGAMTHQVQSNLEAQGVVLSNAESSVLQTSAVNLDEEAANLIRYQQSYQAVAQVVSVASTLFDSLLNATRR